MIRIAAPAPLTGRGKHNSTTGKGDERTKAP